ncbi:LexA family transcriptional regulator [Cytophagaceae bacterium DM2B3-1]|uniref:LexA family transcriptional regulator n=1 Tax=Xanthocytophaga flava TaxID=3048013 RepID=A0ABT7CKC1_9BACT|nr:LexA family transcriptional regulator [Xanthocytophaga flavus]MDJ1494194.1 LexA family transcriptional regulator [Xanthocytophaga flavus]
MYISQNIKYLRLIENLSQKTFGVRFGLTRGQVNSYERGDTEPSVITAMEISNYYSLSVNDFVSKDLQTLGWKIGQTLDSNNGKKEGITEGIEKGLNPSDTKKTKIDTKKIIKDYELLHDLGSSKKEIQILPIVTDPTNDELIAAVPFYAEAGYTSGYQDTEYIKELPTFSVPWLKDGTYRAFQIRGDSMETDLKSGDWVVGRYVTTFKSLQIGTICVVVLKDEGIVCKRVEKTKGNGFILHSNNQMYKSIHPDSSDILEMWEVKMLLRNFYV